MSGTNSKRIVRFGNRVALIKAAPAIQWQASMVEQLVAQRQHPTTKSDVVLTLHIYRARNTGDVDNFQKPVLDALEAAGVLHNDRQVVELHTYKRLDRDHPRIEVHMQAA